MVLCDIGIIWYNKSQSSCKVSPSGFSKVLSLILCFGWNEDQKSSWKRLLRYLIWPLFRTNYNNFYCIEKKMFIFNVCLLKHHHHQWWFQIFLPIILHSWPLGSEGSLLWRGASVYNCLHCDTHTCCQTFVADSGAVTTCFYDLGLSRLGFKHPTFCCEANALTYCAIVAVTCNDKLYNFNNLNHVDWRKIDHFVEPITFVMNKKNAHNERLNSTRKTANKTMLHDDINKSHVSINYVACRHNLSCMSRAKQKYATIRNSIPPPPLWGFFRVLIGVLIIFFKKDCILTSLSGVFEQCLVELNGIIFVDMV